MTPDMPDRLFFLIRQYSDRGNGYQGVPVRLRCLPCLPLAAVDGIGTVPMVDSATPLNGHTPRVGPRLRLVNAGDVWYGHGFMPESTSIPLTERYERFLSSTVTSQCLEI